MKKFFLLKNVFCIIALICLLTVSSVSFGQQGKVPPFRMMQANGKVFKAQDLPMGKPIIIIYFSPDCDHCDKLMKDFLKRTAEFKNCSVAMITYLPIDKVTKFVKDYDLNKYQNVYVGSEGNSFFVRNYYKITDMPFAALYTKNGDLIMSYMKVATLQDLSDKLKKLK